jgi:hypothetical protein
MYNINKKQKLKDRVKDLYLQFDSENPTKKKYSYREILDIVNENKPKDKQITIGTITNWSTKKDENTGLSWKDLWERGQVSQEQDEINNRLDKVKQKADQQKTNEEKIVDDIAKARIDFQKQAKRITMRLLTIIEKGTMDIMQKWKDDPKKPLKLSVTDKNFVIRAYGLLSGQIEIYKTDNVPDIDDPQVIIEV